MDGELVRIGLVTRPHGVLGAVRARPTGPTLASAAPGDTVVVRGPGPGARTLRLRHVGGEAGHPILAFEGVDDRDAAGALAGGELLVPVGRLPALAEPDTVYVRDLIGCEVRVGERVLGRVADVVTGPANDVLEVAGDAGEVLVPFTHDAIPHLDVASRVLYVRPGLLDD